MKKHTLSPTSFFSALVAVSACVALSVVLAGNLAAQQTDTSSTKVNSDEWTQQEAQKSLQEKFERLQNMRQEVSQDANANAQKERDILGQLEGFYNEMVQTLKQQDFNRFWDANRNFDNNTGTFWHALDDTDAAVAQNGLDENWRKDILRSLDDQLRNMKDLERNANQSKDTALLSDIQSFRSSVDGHRSCVQSASTQEALQTCNDAMQSTWDASSKLWTRSDIANRERELKDMERQIKDAEREKTDVSKAKGILEQLRAAIGNVRSLLQSGADNRDVQDAMQESVQPLQQQFYDTINAGQRQGEIARFRNEQLKNMERQIKEIERNKGDVTALRTIVENVKAALANAEQLLQSGTADSRDIDDAFRDLYDKQNEFSNIQNAANRGRELQDREKDLKNMEREFKSVKQQKRGDAEQLQQALEEYKSQLATLKILVGSGTADPETINDAFQDFYSADGNRKFWDIMEGAQRENDIVRWTKKGGEISNMEREVKRLKREKTDVSALETLLNTMKQKIKEIQGIPQEEQNDVLQEVRDLQQEFWDTMNTLNMKSELYQWTRKGGHLAKMEKIVKTLEKKGKDARAAASVLQDIRAAVATLEQSTDRDTLEEGRYELENLRNQFGEAIRPFMKKKSKGGFPFPMKKG